MKKNNYVWDEWSDEEDKAPPPPVYSSSSLTVVSHNTATVGLFNFDEYESNSIANINIQVDAKSIGDEIYLKVDNMKSDLREKIQNVKNLQTELCRLGISKEKKQTKCKVFWETQLQDLKNGNAVAFQKLKDFCDGLNSHVKELNAKKEALMKNIEQNKMEKENALIIAKSESKKKMQRAKKQFENEEKTSIDKVLNSKIELMKKQAADSFGFEFLFFFVYLYYIIFDFFMIEKFNIKKKLLVFKL
jgi:hypothetical protein